MNTSVHTAETNVSESESLIFVPDNSTSLSLVLGSRSVATSATMFVVGVLGNLVAIVVLSISKKEQKETTFYTLVCGMAITDLLGTCFTSPVVIATYVRNRWPGGEPLCHFFSFSMLFFGSAGMSILCAMAVERYLAINHAYFYSQYVDRTMGRLALMATYLVNIVLCVMPSFGFGKHVKHSPGTWCFLDWRAMTPLAASYTFLYGGFMLVLIAVSVLCNFAVCRSLVRMNQRTRLVKAEAFGKQGGSRRRFPKIPSVTAAEMQMFWLLLLMTTVFLACSIPLVVRIFANQIFGPAQLSSGGKVDYRKDLLAIRFASFNPILDPWVYILCRKNLLIKGCERFKMTIGAERDRNRRKVGWVSGTQTPPSGANSNTTSYASLATGNYGQDAGKPIISRTKSFTDFTLQQHWDFHTAQPSFHPFSVEQTADCGSVKLLPVKSQTEEGLPDLCYIIKEASVSIAGGKAPTTILSQELSGQERPVEIVTCAFSTPDSCCSEWCR